MKLTKLVEVLAKFNKKNVSIQYCLSKAVSLWLPFAGSFQIDQRDQSTSRRGEGLLDPGYN